MNPPATRRILDGLRRATGPPGLDAAGDYKSSGCELIAQNPEVLGPGSIGLICVAPVIENGYSQNEHTIFHTMTHDVADFPGWDVFCVDPHISMYIPEPKAKSSGTKPTGPRPAR